MEILDYYSEKSKESIFFQNYLAISLVPASLQSFQPGILYGFKCVSCLLSLRVGKTHEPITMYLTDP